ncbi:DUF5067 domain-containing protein [Listeria booriae]|uniref:DUF5067 domain-containing protein n=1 Tax=Listeria booriae TaxID=1552123 RepID=UPI00164D2DDB|nr:DUF5067 domain-containing protein [Listeria booriae]MBC6150069.1 DUF5067 domain-containing protein [Listeria booriae]
MKKSIILMGVLLVLSLGLVACGTNGDTSTDSKSEKKEDKIHKVGDTVEIDKVKMTLTKVEPTDKRNEFADTKPAKVARVEYTIENNSDQEVAVGSDLEAYDSTKTKLETYPVDGVTLDTVAPGKKINVVAGFGYEKGPLEIQFSPIMSFSDSAKFKVDIQ